MLKRSSQGPQIYPVVENASFLSNLATRYRLVPPAVCPVCQKVTLIAPFKANVRESGTCIRCGSTNRNRQLAHVLRSGLHRHYGFRGGTLSSLVDRCDVRLYNTEAQGSLHNALRQSSRYVCSEYLDEAQASGERVKGVLNQDLRDLSFLDEAFDIVLSSDVLEHVPEPYAAHREIFRVLREGGRHIFTVPFLSDRFLDEPMARVGSDGQVIHLSEPEFHGDPLRPEGALVFTIFSLEMLVRLATIGFSTALYSLNRARNGIFPPGSLVFEATKVRPI